MYSKKRMSKTRTAGIIKADYSKKQKQISCLRRLKSMGLE
jgi:hypothetical protein